MTSIGIQQFSTYASVTLDGSGNGIAFVGPQYPREWWYLDKVGVYVPAGGFPICTVFVGSAITPANMVDQTYQGAGDSTGRVAGHAIHPGEFVWAQWKAGPANSLATMTVWGSK